MSCFSLSTLKLLSWSNFDSVFFTRSAVRRACGLWYQHSFMILTMAVRIWNATTAGGKTNAFIWLVMWQSEKGWWFTLYCEADIQIKVPSSNFFPFLKQFLCFQGMSPMHKTLCWSIWTPQESVLKHMLCGVCVFLSYRMGMEPVVQTGPLLIYTHHLPHLLKAGI